MTMNVFGFETLSKYLRELHVNRGKGMAAYWIEEAGSRTELVRSLGEKFSDLSVLPVAVKKGDFSDTDGVIDDLAKTIEENKSWFTEEKRIAVIRDEKFTLALVSKTPLGVPQLSSPVALPDWFPAWPGRLITVNIVSIGHSVDLSMASSDIPVAGINGALFYLEQAICDRIDAVSSVDPSKLTQLLSIIGGSGGPSNSVLMTSKSRAAVAGASPEDFRPGGAAGSPHIVSMLFRLWWDCSPAKLHDLSKVLAGGLDILNSPNIPAQYSLGSLLTRTATPPPSKTPPGIMFARNVLVTLAHAIQFTNAAHHAGDYPNFPATLSISYAHDIIQSCRRAAASLADVT